MTRSTIQIPLIALASALLHSAVFAHGSGEVQLHVNPKWKECSIQLDPSLTQKAWRQFTEEAGLVTYFRPLADAAPMGKGRVELSMLQWQTGIDDADDAWNDTFVHPDSTHWLFEGAGLKFPGLMLRAGVTNKIALGAYATKNPRANYGFYGGQLQYSLGHNTQKNWAASTRLSFVSLFGPDDLDLTVYGVDLLASREYAIYSTWASVSPYAGVSTYLSSAHETAAAVSLRDEKVLGFQGMVGALFQLSRARIGVEYNLARVNSTSLKVGVGF
ncbi:MAG: hypothetical protein IT369_19175 [Candidatus Latescibacteria bacterium]|nr:hypothetical protein [Candidatus Latescibacterota bacterium]